MTNEPIFNKPEISEINKKRKAKHMRRYFRPDRFCFRCGQPVNENYPVGPVVITVSDPDNEARVHEFCDWECLGHWAAEAAGGELVLDELPASDQSSLAAGTKISTAAAFEIDGDMVEVDIGPGLVFEREQQQQFEVLYRARESKFDAICAALASARKEDPDDVFNIDVLIKEAELLIANWNEDAGDLDSKLQRLLIEYREINRTIARFEEEENDDE